MNPNQERYNRQQQEAALNRAATVVRMREAGETWTTIGKLLGVSRQRAQQLAAKALAVNGASSKATA